MILTNLVQNVFDFKVALLDMDFHSWLLECGVSDGD